MPDVAVATSREVIEQGARRLRAAGVAEARREAQRLWRDLAPPGAQGWYGEGGPAPVETVRAFQQSIRRRAAGEPLAYASGWIGFRRLLLRCDRRALIPRPETEGLVDLVLERVPTGRALDVGTGSGCLALSLAEEGEFGSIVAIDRSAAALGLARENRELLGEKARRVDLVQGDLCGAVAEARFDVLVSNPPYLTETEYAALDPSVRDWEPDSALVSGADGLGATRQLLAQASTVLQPGGWLVLEVDCSRANQAAVMALEDGLAEVSLRKDLFGRARYLLARRRP